ncbi:Na+/H+ antiporter NhaC family protein [Microbacterium sp. PAMC22086]|uniref:Na+/H+ antiporter NhaC family protein n=1 Tax=Microbacterium sp. PAMC22086 TaxID=2861281 RepID=UPI002159A3CE|nr:Na+/H+ antiporter NhaC family protein [Microbacterium sp. PAMC22086]
MDEGARADLERAPGWVRAEPRAGSYLNVLTTGTSMKPVTDRYRVPRTQLGAIMKMTAAPIAVLVPVSTWALFFSGLFEAQGVTVGGPGFGAYLQAIPFIFVGWAALAVALLMSIGWLSKLGVIKRDAIRAERDGDVFPLGTTDDERRAEGAAALAVTLVIVLVQRRLSIRGVLDAALEGIESMLFVMILTVLAFMVQEMNITLQLAEFVIQVTEPVLTPALLPAIVFAVCGIYAYATGSFWDLAAVITPVVLPLALALRADPILARISPLSSG